MCTWSLQICIKGIKLKVSKEPRDQYLSATNRNKILAEANTEDYAIKVTIPVG